MIVPAGSTTDVVAVVLEIEAQVAAPTIPTSVAARVSTRILQNIIIMEIGV
jgi:hypothetical protein